MKTHPEVVVFREVMDIAGRTSQQFSTKATDYAVAMEFDDATGLLTITSKRGAHEGTQWTVHAAAGFTLIHRPQAVKPPEKKAA